MSDFAEPRDGLNSEIQRYRDARILHELKQTPNRKALAAKLGISLRNLLYRLQDMRDRGLAVPPRARGGRKRRRR